MLISKLRVILDIKDQFLWIDLMLTAIFILLGQWIILILAKKFGGNLSKAFANTKTKFFVISFTSDWLYPTQENKEIVIELNAIGADVGFVEIKFWIKDMTHFYLMCQIF
jgi:hypothetical protein